VSFSPDGQALASASNSGKVKLWDINGRELQTLKGHSLPVTFQFSGATNTTTIELFGTYSLDFGSDGQTLATIGIDGIVKLWDFVNGQELQVLDGHSPDHSSPNVPVREGSVNFSHDGRTIISGGSDGIVRIWDVISGQELQTLPGHSGAVNSASFSPDEQAIASASSDGTVKIWDVISGQELQTLPGHSGAVNSVSFSPDGQAIASASSDGTVKIWDVISGQELQTLPGHSGAVNSVSFSPDGQAIASASSDGTVMLWNLDLDDLMVKSCTWLSDYMNNPATPEEHKELCRDELSQVRRGPLEWLAGLWRWGEG
jgi:WD40 repeat protein